MPRTAKDQSKEAMRADAYEKLEFALGKLEGAAQAIRKSIKRLKAEEKAEKQVATT